jgi:TRAP-type mannitol/chloroaromatic compound transport system substrate-binding protein
MSKLLNSSALVGVAALAAVAFTPVAQAKTQKLIVAAPAPGVVTYVAMFTKKVIPEINKRLAASGKDYKIKWVKAYAQAIAKAYETFEAVEENIAQVGLIVKNFEESKLPLEQYATMVPFSGETGEQMPDIDANIRIKVPSMNDSYSKNGQKFIVSGVSPMYDLFTTFPVKSMDDVKGRKIGVSGVLGQYFRGIGAVVVTSSMVESYTSIRSGVYDGYPISIGLAFPFKTYEAAKQYTKMDFGVSTGTAITVNNKVWAGFPRHVKKIFSEVAVDWPRMIVRTDAKKLAKFSGIMKKKGVKFSVMSRKEKLRWANSMPNIAREWAKRQDAKGLPGSAVLAAYFGELKRVNAKMLRDWSM